MILFYFLLEFEHRLLLSLYCPAYAILMMQFQLDICNLIHLNSSYWIFSYFLEVSLKDLIEEVTDLFCSITSTTNQQLAHKVVEKNQTSDPLSTRKEVIRRKEKKNGTSIAFSRPRRHFLHIYKSIFLSSFRLTFGSNKNAFLF